MAEMRQGMSAMMKDTASGTISRYRFADSGALTLINGNAAFLGDMSQPVGLEPQRRWSLSLFTSQRDRRSRRLAIRDDGTLTSLGVLVGRLPVPTALPASLHITRQSISRNWGAAWL